MPDHELPPLDHQEIARYSRHLLLDEVGLAGQQRLKAGSVLCVGTGGLGAPVLMYLAAAGVGRIGIVDFDVVDASNLQRQVIHGTGTLGRKKVESARDRILDINPHLRVDLYDEMLGRDNALERLEPYDVVVDGTDNFPTRYLTNDACVMLGKPLVYGSILRFEGQATVFNYQGGPHYRDLFPTPPPPGLVPSCAEGGVLGVLPAVIGSIQATEAIKILLGAGTSLSGRLLLYDALGMSFRELRYRRNPAVGEITELIDYQQFCAPGRVHDPEDPPPWSRLEPRQVVQRREQGWRPYVLDVRRPGEAAIAQLAFTDRLHPHAELEAILHELPRDRELLVYCKAGGRSTTACRLLVEHGFSQVHELAGGIIRWATEVDPALPRY
ncbi:molybdopterin-synthase adenylyltransferase MoeB [Paraliomyxa miuraensis]|uniref:molybdopterin-synthase adenylyltransferase MoeB n=1 Tax=Paraliomyxa miuraensis TaxID=376150 RepID=UPI00225049F7|nr:molybdopterin-synthase adenylyltransferase MoeB [Paraliomyxa miuraensis]MCX4239983.1 molybdopterin-synthase adenylyltransferase MoeB [Paraliomyxa miuraensis]